MAIEVRVKRLQVIQWWNYLENLRGAKVGRQFAYGAAKCKTMLKDEVDAMSEAIRHIPGYVEYEQKRNAVVVRHAGVEVDGDVQRELAALVEEYRDAVEEYERFINEEVSVSLYGINVQYLPSEITVGEMELMMPFLVEGDDG